jgi:uncharacterized spore protein YtfJ
MEANFEQLLDKLSDHVKEMAQSKTIIGDEFKLGEFTCKPVVKMGVGFGTGGGKGDDEKTKCKGTGAGAGAGIGIAPVGFLISRGDEISFVATDKKKGLQTIFEKVPDLMEKIIEMKKQKEKEEKGKGK